jgi:hypothetical protein
MQVTMTQLVRDGGCAPSTPVRWIAPGSWRASGFSVSCSSRRG